MENKKKLSPEADLVQRTAFLIAESFFSTRRKLNEEFEKYVNNPEISKSFWLEIKIIRERNKIPQLEFIEDSEFFRINKDEEEWTSSWLSEQNKKLGGNINNAINWLLKKYGLPKIFSRWLEHIVLYNKVPPWHPFYDWDLPFQFTNTKIIKNTPLTTQEKSYLKSVARFILGIERRPPGSVKIYNTLLQALKLSPKLKKRPFRTIETAIETLEHGKIVKYYEPNDDKEISYRKTYEDLATNEFSGQTLRKQNQRLRERINKIMGEKKLKK